MVGTTGKHRVDQKDVQMGNDLSCSILQVQDFPVKTKQQQEKPTQTCLTPLPCPAAPTPASVGGKPALTVPRSHLSPFSSAQLSSPCDAVKPPGILSATWLIPLVPSKLHKLGT